MDTVDQTQGLTSLRLKGENIPATEEEGKGEGMGIYTASSHSYQTVFNQKVAGFTLHTFSTDFSYLVTDFIAYTGEIVHSFNVQKNGTLF